MLDELRNYFSSRNVEFFKVLKYSDCREINSNIMEREPFLPKSVIIFLLPYYVSEVENMSRYSASLDYHIGIREISDGLIEKLKILFPDCNAKGYGDHSPIDECHASLISGLGIQGDSGLLINEKYGTYIFIGDVVTDIDPDLLGATSPMPILHCEHCGICKRACPTGILRGEGSDCLSAITQRKGELSDSEVEMMKKFNTVWGCDECQAHCPHNKNPKVTPIEFFHRDRITKLTKEVLDSMDKATFKQRAFAWRGRKTVERNLEKLGY